MNSKPSRGIPYETVFRTMNDIVFIHPLVTKSNPGYFIDANDVAVHKLGYSRDEFRDLTPLDILDSSNVEETDRESNALTTEKSLLFEKTLIAKDGRRIPVEINARLFNYEGTPAVCAIARDINERKRSERKLEQAKQRLTSFRKDKENKLRAALENSILRESEFASLLEGARAVLRHRTFTESAREIFNHCKKITGAASGYVALLSSDGSENEVLFLDAGGLNCTVDPSLPMPIRGLRNEAYRHKKALFHNDFMKSAWAQFMPPGHVRLDNVLFAPLIVESRAVGIIGLANKKGDFTDRDATLAAAFGELASVALVNNRSVQSLQESESRYRNLVESLLEGIWILDKDGITTFINDHMAEMVGRRTSEMLGRHAFDFLDAEHTKQAAEYLERRKQGIKEQHEFEILHKKGHAVPVLMQSAPVFNEHGAYAGTIAGISDISEQKKMQHEKEALREQLNQAQKMEAIGQLAAGIAHDFNNILAGIIGYAEIIGDMVDDRPKIREFSEKAIASAQRAAGLSRQLLTFARKARVTMQPVGIIACISHVMEILEHTIDKRIEISSDLCSGDPLVYADESQVQNCLLNLGINAADAMPDGGTLHFSAQLGPLPDAIQKKLPFQMHAGSWIKITVSDTGTGIDRKIRSKIFDPFFTTKEVGKGTGLGLATVYGTIKQHNGYITCRSRKGKGTQFTIYLPLHESSSVPEKRNTEAVCRNINGHALIIDDEAIIREIAADMLERLGYSVSCCCDGHQGIEFVRKSAQQPDLILLDLIMPKMNGFECFKTIQSIAPSIKVIAMTGYADEKKQQRILAEGAAGFIGKPFRIHELSAAITGDDRGSSTEETT
ncbi:MAG: PAS domain S-box protein [Chitinivibrionales bacterium]|nr:PAS domain S-box protein [Chitinivibrionales bacterium]